LGASKDFDQVVFEVDDRVLEDAVAKLAAICKARHKYTDLANFTLKCTTCSQGLVGQGDAQKHALSTGHSNFTEYD
jgi:ubiquitin thioesterase OTU1